METLLITAGIVAFSLVAGFVTTRNKSHAVQHSKQKSIEETSQSNTDKVLSAHQKAILEKQAYHKKVQTASKQLQSLEKGILLYNNIVQALYKRDIRPSTYLLDYARFAHVDIAHTFALRIEKNRNKDVALRVGGTEFQLLQLYDMEIDSKASEYTGIWHSFNSLLIRPRQERLFKQLHNHFLTFFLAEREKAKEFAQKNFDQTDTECLMFYYDNQDLFLRYISYFSNDTNIFHILSSVPDEARFQLIGFLIDDTKTLRESAKKISTSLSMHVVDDFITASKLARAKKEN